MSTHRRLCPFATGILASHSLYPASGSLRSSPCSRVLSLSRTVEVMVGPRGFGFWYLMQFPYHLVSSSSSPCSSLIPSSYGVPPPLLIPSLLQPKPLFTNCSSTISVYFCCPETRGKSLEEIDLVFMSHNLQDSAAGQTLARGGVSMQNEDSGASSLEAGIEKEVVSVEGKT